DCYEFIYVIAFAPIVLNLNISLHSSAFGFHSNAFAYAIRAIESDADKAVIASPYCFPFQNQSIPVIFQFGSHFHSI
ncbi:MAG: hypothetical protein EZS28_050271, partial [Streblomastix strix]